MDHNPIPAHTGAAAPGATEGADRADAGSGILASALDVIHTDDK